jgi:hypothetical protein
MFIQERETREKLKNEKAEARIITTHIIPRKADRHHASAKQKK